MTDARDFELPESFVHKIRQARMSGGLKTDSRLLVDNIAEQTGFSSDAIVLALAEEGIIEFCSRGILF